MIEDFFFNNGFGGFVAFLVSIFVALGLLVGAIMAIITPIALHQTQVSCVGYQRATGIPTKFVEYNTFWDYGCVGYVNGHWVSTDNIQGVNGINH